MIIVVAACIVTARCSVRVTMYVNVGITEQPTIDHTCIDRRQSREVNRVNTSIATILTAIIVITHHQHGENRATNTIKCTFHVLEQRGRLCGIDENWMRQWWIHIDQAVNSVQSLVVIVVTLHTLFVIFRELLPKGLQMDQVVEMKTIVAIAIPCCAFITMAIIIMWIAAFRSLVCRPTSSVIVITIIIITKQIVWLKSSSTTKFELEDAKIVAVWSITVIITTCRCIPFLPPGTWQVHIIEQNTTDQAPLQVTHI